MTTPTDTGASTLSVPRDQIQRAAQALKAFEHKRNPLHDDDDTGVFLGIKRNNVDLHFINRPKLFPVPHTLMANNPKICLFIKDFDEDDKSSKALFNELKLKLDKVLLQSKLKRKYSSFDNLRQLASRFDLFLVDERTLRAAYSILGRTFAKKAHKPIPVKLEGATCQEVEEKINKIKQSAVYMDANGPITCTKVAQVGFSADHISDNVLAAIEAVQTKFEDAKNINLLYVKTPSSPALTIYQVLPEVGEESQAMDVDVATLAQNQKNQKKQKNGVSPSPSKTQSTPKPSTPTKKDTKQSKKQIASPKPTKTQEDKQTNNKKDTTPKTPSKQNGTVNGKEEPKSGKKRVAEEMEGEEPVSPATKKGKKGKKEVTPQKTPAKEQKKEEKKEETPAKETPAKGGKKEEAKKVETPKGKKEEAKKVETPAKGKKEETKKVETPAKGKKEETKKVETPAKKEETKKVETPKGKKVESTPAKKEETKKVESTPAKKEETKKVETPANKKQKKAEEEKVETPAKKQMKAESTPEKKVEKKVAATPKATPSKKTPAKK